MSIVSEKIHGILNELESDSGQGTRSAEQIARILLGEAVESKHNEKNSVQPVASEQKCKIDMYNMEQPREGANQTWEIQYHRPIYSHRRIIGRAIVFGKRVTRKILKFLIEPIVKDQTQFNSNAVKTLNAMRNNDVVFQANISRLMQENAENKSLCQNMKDKCQELEASSELRYQEIREQNEQRFDKFQEALEQLNTKVEQQHIVIEELLKQVEATQTYHNIDYFDFENHFRGNHAEMKKKQAGYIQYFAGCNNVVDLGCGRGEFLELLHENGISATGVDLYEPFVDYCRARGHKIVHEDIIAYLQQQQDNTIDGIIGLQVVEHISANDLVALCREAYRVLQTGKKLILETPNPTCMATYLNSFYLDPSHVKPVHPKTLEYFLKKEGFTEVQIVFTEESKVDYRLPLLDVEGKNLAEFNDGINFVSDVMFGSQDYAIIAVK